MLILANQFYNIQEFSLRQQSRLYIGLCRCGNWTLTIDTIFCIIVRMQISTEKYLVLIFCNFCVSWLEDQKSKWLAKEEDFDSQLHLITTNKPTKEHQIRTAEREKQPYHEILENLQDPRKKILERASQQGIWLVLKLVSIIKTLRPHLYRPIVTGVLIEVVES